MTIAYVESSAIVKLAIWEPETEALNIALAHHDDLVSSALALVEVTRAAARVEGPKGIARAADALVPFALVGLDRPVLDRAARLGPAGLRSLDAIHVATALELGPEAVFVSYDERALGAASVNGLGVLSPR